jgi:glycolate oxidase FAD binding subunit
MGGTGWTPPAGRDWAACRELQLPWFTARAADHCLWRLSVPQTAPELALPPARPRRWSNGMAACAGCRPRAAGAALKAAARAVGGDALLFSAEAAQPSAANRCSIPRMPRCSASGSS